jgi:hypothetical protein
VSRAFWRAALIVLLPGPLAAQTVRVSGTIVDERQAPIQGAVVRITGNDTSMTTGPSGTFALGSVLVGRAILAVAAPTYEPRSIPIDLSRDTVLTIAMRSRIATLDPMVVRPTRVRVRGSVVDSLTGEPILFAIVSLYPGGRTAEASNIGNFRFDTVPAGPTILVAEAVEHVPVHVMFDARRDTTLKIRLPIDSVAIRMMAEQAKRLSKRSQSTPLPIRQFGRDDIAREARGTVGELVDRLNLAPPGMRGRNAKSADEACVFYDDRKIAPGMMDGLYPELVERVEIYQRGAMIRIYSKRYVMSLAGQELLRGIKYFRAGMGVVCD